MNQTDSWNGANIPDPENNQNPGAAITAPSGGLPPIINAQNLITDQTILTPMLIVDSLFHRGSKVAIGGSSKSRKSWTLLQLAVAVATGVNWLNFITYPGKVLFINLEIPSPFLKHRLTQIAKAMGAPELTHLDVWNLRGRAGRLWPNWLKVMEAVRNGDYCMVIIDPIYKLLTGLDENKAGDIGQLCDALEQLAVDGNTAIVYAAHYSKGNQATKAAMDRISGSGVFGRDADTILTMTNHKEPDCYTVEATLRNLPEVKPFVVQWKFPLMQVRSDLDPRALERTAASARDYPAELLDMLPRAGLRSGKWQAMAAARGISRSSFERARSELVEDGLVEKDGMLYFRKSPQPPNPEASS